MSTTALQMLYITSCADPLMWYSDRVGQFVPLLRRLPEGGWGSQEPDGHRNVVKRLDAEEVTVTVPADKIGRWPHVQPAHKLVHIVSKDVVERARAAAPTPFVLPNIARMSGSPLTAQAQCLDLCLLGSCKGLGDCREARAEPTAPPPTTGQSRLGSMTETVANLVIGFVISVLITAAVLPWYGHAVTMQENIEITAIFTVASLLRTYGLRRLFNLFSSRA